MAVSLFLQTVLRDPQRMVEILQVMLHYRWYKLRVAVTSQIESLFRAKGLDDKFKLVPALAMPSLLFTLRSVRQDLYARRHALAAARTR